MSWSREEALTDPAVKEPMIFVSEFRFNLRDIPTEITMRIYRPLQSSRIIVRRSHNLSIPELGAPPAAKESETGSEGEALHGAVDEMVRYYNEARTKGLKPDASWLVPNANFA